MGVVVADVVDDEAFELSLVPDDGAVEQLSSQGCDPAFSESVRDRGADRALEDLEALGSEDLVEGVKAASSAAAPRPNRSIGVYRSE